jgi:hypothetical protein
VLGTPPAFVLSQDQTLQLKLELDDANVIENSTNLRYVPSIRSAQTLRCSECPQLLALDDGVERVATA